MATQTCINCGTEGRQGDMFDVEETSEYKGGWYCYECDANIVSIICREPAPDTIEFYSSHFGGEGRAKCTECTYISAYWECNCELVHDCNEHQ